MNRNSFSRQSDFENPYQPPEFEGKLTAETKITARPMLAMLLTTFGGGVFVLAFMAGAVVVFGSFKDLRDASAYFIPTYTYWTVFPGLVSGLIARQISLGRSTNRELILVAAVILVPAMLVIGNVKRAGDPVLSFHAFAVLSLVFQFCFASKIGRFCCGRKSDEGTFL